MNKPKLCIALMHDYAARDFLDSGVLEDLFKVFNLSFVCTQRLTLDLKRFGPIYYYLEPTGFRLRFVQLARGLFHMSDKGRFELNRRHALARATFGIGGLNTRMISWLSAIGLSTPVGIVIRFYLRLTLRESLPGNYQPDAFLAYTSVNSYFADDMVREAMRKKIPLLALTNNWDNLNTKSFVEPPPYLGVWGEQGFLIARLMHLIPPHRIFIIGSPRFEIYRKLRPSKTQARKILNLKEDARVLLFCGAGVSFEESSLIIELEEAIAGGAIPHDVVILYKPHPLRFKRANEKMLDFSLLKHVKLLESNRGLSELDVYPIMMAAADGVISPFSTMVIEGALAGLPALCLGYNDPGHANHDWNRAGFNLHLYPIRHGDWAIVCSEREKFLECCKNLIGLLDDNLLANQSRAAAEMIFTFGSKTVSQRISDSILRIISGCDADDSFVLSKRVGEFSNVQHQPSIISSKD